MPGTREREAGCRRVLASLYWDGPSELPHRRSSSSAPRRDSTEPRPARDGQRFSTVGFEGVCRVWDIDGREASPVFQNSVPVTVYIFSPDGRRLLLGGRDGSITSWDHESGSQAAWLPPHTSFVTFMASSQDGSKVVTTSD